MASLAVLLLIILLPPRVALSAVRTGGRVETNLRLAVQAPDGSSMDSPEFLDFRDTVVVGAWVRALGGDISRATVDADLRVHQAAQAGTMDETSDSSLVLPLSIRLNKAMVELRDLGGGHVDLLLGVQRVAWGQADGLHVVDRLNPWDLENPLSLDARLPIPMARALLHRGALQLDAALAPLFFPAVLPVEGVDLVPTAQDLVGSGGDFGDSFEGVTINEVEARVTTPHRSLDNMAVGLRLSWAAAAADFALSYYHGRDSLPQASGELVLTGFQTSQSRVDVALPFIYPRMDLLGLEARGEIFLEMGAWVEAALVFPATTEIYPSQAQWESLYDLGTVDQLPDPLPTVVTQDGSPYLTWIMGLERAWGRVYLNLQWLRGFPTERQGEDLNDYASLAARFTLSDTLVMELGCLADVMGEGFMTTGRLNLLHGDAAELYLAAAWIVGSEGSTLEDFQGVSNVGAGASLQF